VKKNAGTLAERDFAERVRMFEVVARVYHQMRVAPMHRVGTRSLAEIGREEFGLTTGEAGRINRRVLCREHVAERTYRRLTSDDMIVRMMRPRCLAPAA
jgi:hypothetical protein